MNDGIRISEYLNIVLGSFAWDHAPFAIFINIIFYVILIVQFPFFLLEFQEM